VKKIAIIIFAFISISTVASATSIIEVYPNQQNIVKTSTFEIAIHLKPDGFVKGWEFKVRFDPEKLQANSVISGDFYQDYLTMFNPGIIDNENGTIINIYGLIVAQQGNVSEDGTLVFISFTAKDATGDTAVSIYEAGITNEAKYLPLTVVNGTVTLRNTHYLPTEDWNWSDTWGFNYTNNSVKASPIKILDVIIILIFACLVVVLIACILVAIFKPWK
jgi:hypothetical protein